jgi:multiple antibiotic resistance protein
LLGPFVQRTHGLDEATVRRIALHAFVIATAAVIVGGWLGSALARKWNVTVPAMMLTAGIVFFIVALRQLLDQYEPAHAAVAAPLPASPLASALRLTFPIVLTPYGVATVIAMLAATRDVHRVELIAALLLGVMLLNLLAMLFARRIMSGVTLVLLQLLGAVLAVIQVALAVQIVIDALQRLHVIPA